MNGKIENKIREQIRMDLRKKVGCHVANQVWDDIVTQVFDVVYYNLYRTLSNLKIPKKFNLKRNN